jgi:hypothetical protein
LTRRVHAPHEVRFAHPHPCCPSAPGLAIRFLFGLAALPPLPRWCNLTALD